MGEFWDWWQHLPQHISPVIFEIGWFRLQYYGLMYIVAFAFTYFLVLYRIRHEERFGFSKKNKFMGFVAYIALRRTSYPLSIPSKKVTATGIAGKI